MLEIKIQRCRQGGVECLCRTCTQRHLPLQSQLHGLPFRPVQGLFPDVLQERKLHSLLPAHEREDIFCSHFGLTYGGLIMNKDVTAADVVQLFKELNEYLRQQGFKRYYTNLCLGFTTRCHPKKIFMPSIGYARHAS